MISAVASKRRTVLTKLYEGVWPCGSTNLVSVLAVKLLREVVQKGKSQLLVESSIAEGQETDILLNDVTVKRE